MSLAYWSSKSLWFWQATGTSFQEPVIAMTLPLGWVMRYFNQKAALLGGGC
jgi:hypothetical protein